MVGRLRGPLLLRTHFVQLAFLFLIPNMACGLVYQITDFSADLSGNSADTARVDALLGDSLEIEAETHDPRRMFTSVLNDSSGSNGRAGSSPIVSFAGGLSFKVAYLAWQDAHVRHDGVLNPPPADIRVRNVGFGKDTAMLDSLSGLLAYRENIKDTEGRFYGSANVDQPPPGNFHFTARGSQYASYWGTQRLAGSYRRTTHVDSMGKNFQFWGSYLSASGIPVVGQGFGTIGMAPVPTAGNLRTVVAYEVSLNPARAHVRLENLTTGGTSQIQDQLTSNAPMEDFAIAVDSLGTILVVWRQLDTAYAAVLGPGLTILQGATPIVTGIQFADAGLKHFYQPHQIARADTGEFIYVYGRAGRIYRRTLGYPSGGPLEIGVETAVTPGGRNSLWPAVRTSDRFLFLSYFWKQAAESYRFMVYRYDRLGSFIDTGDPWEADFGGETIGFDKVGQGWYPWHHLHIPSIDIDEAGNMVGAWDNQFDAKVSAFANVPVYYDSARYASRAISVRNPAISYVFDQQVDSVEFFTVSLQSDTGVIVQLAASEDAAFTNGENYVTVMGGGLTSRIRGPYGHFKYKLQLRSSPDNFWTPAVHGLSVRYNVRPHSVDVDSIRIGEGPVEEYDGSKVYTLQNRRDSLHFTTSVFDLDDVEPMIIRMSGPMGTGKLDSATRFGSGRYRAHFSVAPLDTLSDSVVFAFQAQDSSGWTGPTRAVRIRYANTPPSGAVRIVRNLGRDDNGIYNYRGGGYDTLFVADGDTIQADYTDSLWLTLFASDANDTALQWSVRRNGNPELAASLFNGSDGQSRIAMDVAPPLVDSMQVLLSDPDTTIGFHFHLRPNRSPAGNLLRVEGFRNGQGEYVAGPFDSLLLNGVDTGIQITPLFENELRLYSTDPDTLLGDSVTTTWEVFRFQEGCVKGDLSCYSLSGGMSGAAMEWSFALTEEFIRVRVTDQFGAFVLDTIKMEFPFLDTSAVVTNPFSSALSSAQDIRFVLHSQITRRDVKVELPNYGTIPLTIPSIKTGRNDESWMHYSLQWTEPGQPGANLVVRNQTQTSPILATHPARIYPGERFSITLTFFVDSLSGDDERSDTLFIQTNDFRNPLLKLPIKVSFDDLPMVSIALLGDTSGVQSEFPANDVLLPQSLPHYSGLQFAFSEPVLDSALDASVVVYSVRDSAVEALTATSPGRLGGTMQRVYHRYPWGGVSDKLVDSLVFRVRADRASPHFGVRPPPGYFTVGDVIGIRISNLIQDSVGNGLDLRLDRVPRAPGTMDTVFRIPVDSSRFRVTRSVPSPDAQDWNPDRPMQIFLSHPVSPWLFRGADSVAALDLQHLQGDSNKTIQIRSGLRGNRVLDLKFIRLGPGDSSLVFQTEPLIGAFDSVQVKLSHSLSGGPGLSLDGNGDGLPGFLYNPADTLDAHVFTFWTGKHPFYVFPNPFRYSDIRHRQKGAVTFKNLNSLDGFQLGAPIDFRIFDMTGNPIYDSRVRDQSPVFGDSGSEFLAPEWDWELLNIEDRRVGTGVYIFTISREDGRVLAKGKVAVIR